MKMKFFKLSFLISFVFLLIFFLSYQTLVKTYIFDSEIAYSHVKQLSSPTYEGRKPSTEGNIKALEYSEKILKDYGYEVIRQPFRALIPFLDAIPLLELIDENNQVVQSFVHRLDFKEALGGYSFDGDFTGKFLIDSKSVNEKKDKIFNNSIVIVDNDYNGYPEQDLVYINARVKALLIPASDNSIKKASGYPGSNKSSYISNNQKRIMKIYITYDLYSLLKSKCKQIDEKLYESEKIKLHVSLPLKFKFVNTENLIALLDKNISNIKEDNLYFLGFSAHIDHLGKDPNGNYFPGALDNASGVAFCLEIAKILAAYKDKLTVKPIIILFNAEENGLCGSYHFVHSGFMDLSKLRLINSDMVASSIPVVYNLLFYQGNKSNHPAKEFALKIRSFAVQNNFKFSLDNLSTNTDHYYFDEAGFAAVSFNQFPESFYHTYEDSEDKVSKDGFEQLGRLMENFIVENYSIKTQNSLFIFIFLIVIFIAFILKEKPIIYE